MDLERELLGVFGGYEILMAKCQRELLVGLEISESGGIGVSGSARFGIEIVFEDVGDLEDGAMSVDIQISRHVDYPRIERLFERIEKLERDSQARR